MKKREIYVLQGGQVCRMTQEACRQAALAEMIQEKCKSRSCRIVLKPNLLGPIPAEEGATTHPEIAEGVIRYLQGQGFSRITVCEGSWVGDRTEDSLLVTGYRDLLDRLRIPFVDLQEDSYREVSCAGMGIPICETVLDADFLINLPVMKGHCQTQMTCALKNLKGCLPNFEKRAFHRMGLMDPIGHLAAGLGQDFILTDCICPDLTFEDGGNPTRLNRIFASADPVLNDAFCCRLMGVTEDQVPYLRIARECGAGCGDLTQADLHFFREEVREDGSCLYLPEDRDRGGLDKATEEGARDERRTGLPGGGSRACGEPCRPAEDLADQVQKARIRVRVRELVQDVDSCSACYGTLIPVLTRLQARGYPVDKLQGLCIGQGYRGRSGKLGIGTCTRLFEKTLPGCPPKEEEMEAWLRQVLMEHGEKPAGREGLKGIG